LQDDIFEARDAHRIGENNDTPQALCFKHGRLSDGIRVNPIGGGVAAAHGDAFGIVQRLLQARS
jgi:hypothetical protein